MQEDYLHYLWEFQKWRDPGLLTADGAPVAVLSPGQHNFLSGPDFFNSRIALGDQEWAGNVEIHINSSDWFRHGHDSDPAYDNVILHVVWNHDAEVSRKDNSLIPVLELKNLVSNNTLQLYENLLLETRGKWINCEKDFPELDDFTLQNWLERIYFERLEAKSGFIYNLLKKSSGDWEEVIFKLLARNFGLNVNGDAFLSMADSLPFSVVKKCRGNRERLEALFFGQAGLLEKEVGAPYFKVLKDHYLFLKNKFSLTQEGGIPVKYFRLRPDNFPEIRLSQFAAVYNRQPHLFSQVMQADDPDVLKELLSGSAAGFWQDHFTFTRSHHLRKKPLTSAFLELLIINTVVPLKFCYLKEQGKEGNDVLMDIMRLLPAESNQIIRKFNSLRPGVADNAFKSQAVLQLKKEYCDRNKCLHCSLGVKILQRQQ